MSTGDSQLIVRSQRIVLIKYSLLVQLSLGDNKDNPPSRIDFSKRIARRSSFSDGVVFAHALLTFTHNSKEQSSREKFSKCLVTTRKSCPLSSRGIEWSLRAFASMRAVRLFFQARAVINFLMRVASTLEITNGEHFVNFSPAGISLLLKRFAPSNLANTFKTGQRWKARQHDKAL